ncbi:hypothetical protein HCN44_001319 [Aphidius gifuensis]|uniref:Uncharacterized protein n=1 Tax=Aphidius gifuensis TaxID=684658 RepID=A0A834XYZ0_APHGI|nr:hypothetical protein HCN44_001319 [Aphidius gifuensis]
MVKRKAPPKREWKIYSVHILAAANTYSRAEIKVKDLEKKPYAFTDDGDPEGQVAQLNSSMRVFLMKQKNDTTDSSTDELEVDSIQNSVTDEIHDEHNDAINDYTPTRDNDVTASMNLDQDYIVTDSLAEDVFLSEVGLASNQDHKKKYVIKK